MAKLKINHYVVGPVQTNCYFAINDETKELIIIDPGYSPKQLAERVRQEGCTPVAILLTHGHFDHATGAADLAKEFSIPVYAYETEKETLENEEMNLCHMTGEHHVFHADIYLKDEQELDLAGFHIRVLHTPGAEENLPEAKRFIGVDCFEVNNIRHFIVSNYIEESVLDRNMAQTSVIATI